MDEGEKNFWRASLSVVFGPLLFILGGLLGHRGIDLDWGTGVVIVGITAFAIVYIWLLRLSYAAGRRVGDE